MTSESTQPVAEGDGTVTVPPNENLTAFLEQADGAPYGQIESGGRVRVAGEFLVSWSVS